jgi:hypothetical protein
MFVVKSGTFYFTDKLTSKLGKVFRAPQSRPQMVQQRAIERWTKNRTQPCVSNAFLLGAV